MTRAEAEFGAGCDIVVAGAFYNALEPEDMVICKQCNAFYAPPPEPIPAMSALSGLYCPDCIKDVAEPESCKITDMSPWFPKERLDMVEFAHRLAGFK